VIARRNSTHVCFQALCRVGCGFLCCPAGAAQNSTAHEAEEHRQHMTSGLVGGVIIKGDEHATHSLADRMKELNVPGVSIAVIHSGEIEWARGFGVQTLGGSPSLRRRCSRPALSASPLRRRLSQLRESCATLTKSLVHNVGQAMGSKPLRPSSSSSGDSTANGYQDARGMSAESVLEPLSSTKCSLSFCRAGQ